MQFSAHDLRYNLELCFPSFYAYLQQRAKRWLGSLSHDSVEVDQVVEHIIEQLTRLGLIGAKDNAPQTEFERLSNAQFYAFLNRSIKNKAIDRLRKNRPPVTSVAELEGFGGMEDEKDPLDDTSISIWGDPPFATPEEAAMEAAYQEVLRSRIKNCIRALANAPHQLQALEQEFEEIGVDDLVRFMRKEFAAQLDDVIPAHLSQHKDHAHRKLRQCLQRSSAHLRVLIALRITEYAVRSTGTDESSVTVAQLMHDEHGKQDISEREVIAALECLVSRNLLDWKGEGTIRFSSVQGKRVARFYEEED
jgi:DNA-directed RNA polymerase specialized sigma24 family protein